MCIELGVTISGEFTTEVRSNIFTLRVQFIQRVVVANSLYIQEADTFSRYKSIKEYGQCAETWIQAMINMIVLNDNVGSRRQMAIPVPFIYVSV